MLQELEQQKELNHNPNTKMTEKNYNPEQMAKKTIRKTEPAVKMKKTKTPKAEDSKEEIKPEETKKEETKAEQKTEEKKPEPKKIIKRNEVVVNSYSLPISTKNSMAICRFIKRKTIENAMKDLQLVLEKRKVLPMKGEIPHRKGRGIMSGGYPQNATKEFMILLKSLAGSANMHGLDEPVIVECVPNMASRPYGRFGAWRRKSTHVKIVAKEKKDTEKGENKK